MWENKKYYTCTLWINDEEQAVSDQNKAQASFFLVLYNLSLDGLVLVLEEIQTMQNKNFLWLQFLFWLKSWSKLMMIIALLLN